MVLETEFRRRQSVMRNKVKKILVSDELCSSMCSVCSHSPY